MREARGEWGRGLEEVKVEERVGERGGRGVESGCGRSAAIAAARRGQRGGGGGAAGCPRRRALHKINPSADGERGVRGAQGVAWRGVRHGAGMLQAGQRALGVQGEG